MSTPNSGLTPNTELTITHIPPSATAAPPIPAAPPLPAVEDTSVTPALEQPASQAPAPRRSTRIRNRAAAPPVLADGNSSSSSSSINRLDQIACSSIAELGLEDEPLSGMQVRVHPIAAALINFHAHLTRTEVIGYLGGGVYSPPDRPGETHVIVAEAFPVKALTDREMSRTGRNSYMEVEISPESSVNVMCYIDAKGLSVVGWYHSHPDPAFTIEPSRVDIQNQLNYQNMLFKGVPFVGAIIAPYNRDLPDHCSALDFFAVWGQDIPVRVPYRLDTLASVPSDFLPVYWGTGTRPYRLSEVRSECQVLVNDYKQSARRVRITREWRDGVSFAGKLGKIMTEFGSICRESDAANGSASGEDAPGDAAVGCTNGNGGESSGSQTDADASSGIVSQADRFEECMKEEIRNAEQEFKQVEEREEQQLAQRRKRGAAGRSKRSRRK